MNLPRVRETLIRHEGLRLKPYRCSAGKLTIGVGRNLEDTGITELEAHWLLMNDITRVGDELLSALPWISKLDDVRQEVLCNMAFNLGTPGLLKFKRTLLAVQYGEYEAASRYMLESKWAKQVGARASELSQAMKTGII